MRIIRWNDGTRWGDPNTRWGSPSYLLEPGDAGYVAPAAPLNQPKKWRSRMTRNTYWPTRIGDQTSWLNNFILKLPVWATPLGLAGGVVTAIQADCAWLIYVLSVWLPAVRTFSESCTDAVTEAETGDGTALMMLTTFTAPGGGTAVNTGALNRIFQLVQLIKDNPVFTEQIGTDLGVIGSEKTAPDFTTFGPVLKVTRAPAGVTVGWGWQGKHAFMDMIELQVDRGAGYVLLAFDTTPGYVDTEAIPASPTKWKYRAIYRSGDQRVGQWSAEASVNVGG